MLRGKVHAKFYCVEIRGALRNFALAAIQEKLNGSGDSGIKLQDIELIVSSFRSADEHLHELEDEVYRKMKEKE